MKIIVEIETDSADDGEDEPRPFHEHKDDICELLRSGYYNVSVIREVIPREEGAEWW